MNYDELYKIQNLRFLCFEDHFKLLERVFKSY